MKRFSVFISVVASIWVVSLPAQAENATQMAIEQGQQAVSQTQQQMALDTYNQTQQTSAMAAGLAGDPTYCASYGACQYQKVPQASGNVLDLNRILFGKSWEQLTSPPVQPAAQAVPSRMHSHRHALRYSRNNDDR